MDWKFLKRCISAVVLVAFMFSSVAPSYAQLASMTSGSVLNHLPAPGTMVALSQSFHPPLLKGIKVYADDPFRFDFILDKGDAQATDKQLKTHSNRLIKYFLASLTVPEKDLWVNLSPYEKDRIVPEAFGVTEMGRDLLAQDYMLKQITASVIYPEGEVGKKFWAEIYRKAQERFGTTDIPIDTFNKVWIVPEKALVYENVKAGTAYVVESRLKVMLETDYLAQENSTTTNDISKQVLREVVIPVLEKEVNEGANFTQLRQVYQSLILATWYKKKIKESLLSQMYVDQKKVVGVDIDDKAAKDKLWAQYVDAFKKGAYNYIKEDHDAVTGEVAPKKYFSGGAEFNMDMMAVTDDADAVTRQRSDNFAVVKANFNIASSKAAPSSEESIGADPAMLNEVLVKLNYKRVLEDLVGVSYAELDEEVKKIIQIKGINDFVKMAEATGPNAGYLFKYGLLGARRIFNTPEGLNGHWDDLVKIVIAVGPHAGDLLEHELLATRKLYNTPEEFQQCWRLLVRMAEAAGPNAGNLFEYGLPEALRVFKTPEEIKTVSDIFIKMLESNRSNVDDILKYGLPAARDTFNTLVEFKDVINDLVEITKTAGPDAGYFLRYGLAVARNIFKTPKEFKEHWDGFVVMAKAAWPKSGYLFLHGLRETPRLFRTFEEFKQHWHDLVEIVKVAGPNAGDLLRYGLPAVRQHITSQDRLLEYARSMNKVFSFMEDEQINLFFNFTAQSIIAENLLVGPEINSRYAFALFLLKAPLNDEEKNVVLVKFLEPYVFSYPEELTTDIVEEVLRVYQNDEKIKYLLYYIKISSRAPPEVKKWADNYLQQKQLFKVQPAIAEHLKTGKKTVLAINNISDGQGDELIRMATLLQGFLDYNPELTITVVTGRPYLYDHPMVNVVPISEVEQHGYGWAGFQEIYDVVIDHYDGQENHSPNVEWDFQASGVLEKAFIYVRSNKSNDYFTFEKVVIDGQEAVDFLGLKTRRSNNVYETAFKLVSEFGLPLRAGQEITQEGSLINEKTYPAAEEKWSKMMVGLGNELEGERYKSPVVLFNPYGGETAGKGFGRNAIDQKELIQTLGEIVEKGYKIVLLPNGNPWGTRDIAVDLLASLPETTRRDCIVSDEPSVDPRLFKYYVGFSDYVLTVEGGMMHLAFNMGKPFGVIMKSGAGSDKWIPYGRTSMQGVVLDVGDAVRTYRERRIDQGSPKAPQQGLISDDLSADLVLMEEPTDDSMKDTDLVRVNVSLLSAGRVSYGKGQYIARHTDRRQPFKNWMSLARSLFHAYDSELLKLSGENVSPEYSERIYSIINGLRDGFGANIGQILQLRSNEIRRRLGVMRAAVAEKKSAVFTDSGNGLNRLSWAQEPELEGVYTQIRVAMRIVQDRGISQETSGVILKALGEAEKRLGLLDDLKLLFDRYEEEYVSQRGSLGSSTADDAREMAFEKAIRIGEFSSPDDQIPRLLLLFYQLVYVSARAYPDFFKALNTRIHHRPLAEGQVWRAGVPQSFDNIRPEKVGAPAGIREAWQKFDPLKLEAKLQGILPGFGDGEDSDHSMMLENDLTDEDKALIRGSFNRMQRAEAGKTGMDKPLWLFGEKEIQFPFWAATNPNFEVPRISPEYVLNKKVLVVPGYGNLPFAIRFLGAREVVAIDKDPITIAWQKLKWKTGQRLESSFFSFEDSNPTMLELYFEEWLSFLDQPVADTAPSGMVFKTADILKPIPITGEKYELIVVPYLFGITYGLEREEDWQAALENLKDVLAPDGRIILTPGKVDLDRFGKSATKEMMENSFAWIDGLKKYGWRVEHSARFGFRNFVEGDVLQGGYVTLSHTNLPNPSDAADPEHAQAVADAAELPEFDEGLIDRLPEQMALVKSMAPLEFGPGSLYHLGESLDQAIAQTAIPALKGNIFLTRAPHKFLHFNFIRGAGSPYVAKVSTTLFNKLADEGHARLEVPGVERSSGIIDPYPRILQSLALSDVDEIWIRPLDWERYQRVLAGEEGSDLLRQGLKTLIGAGKIRTVSALSSAQQPLRPDPEVFKTYLESRGLQKEIPAFRRAGDNTGGIDLRVERMDIQTTNSGDGIKFNINSAQLEQFMNAPGLTPVIISIQPLESLSQFLGINGPALQAVGG